MAGSAPARRAHLSGLSDAWPLPAGVGLLALLWLGPLPEMSRTAFSAHMILHLGIVAAAAPLLAIGLNRTRYGFANLRPGLKSAAALDRLFDKARHLSGLDEGDVEELAGNSDAAQSGDSTSV